jgi:Protein of unknown function (DUF2281)
MENNIVGKILEIYRELPENLQQEFHEYLDFLVKKNEIENPKSQIKK